MNLISQPYRILAIVILWLASLISVGLWQRHDGSASVEAKWQKREAIQQTQHAEQITKLNQALLLAEHNNANAQADIAAKYERKLYDAKTQHDLDVAAIRAGRLRLRDPAHVSTCADSASKTSSSSGIGNGSQAGGLQATDAGFLSAEATGFLVDLATDADQIANQLTACQAVIISDRK